MVSLVVDMYKLDWSERRKSTIYIIMAIHHDDVH